MLCLPFDKYVEQMLREGYLCTLNTHFEGGR